MAPLSATILVMCKEEILLPVNSLTAAGWRVDSSGPLTFEFWIRTHDAPVDSVIRFFQR
jgi:hypothetical protein